MIASDWTKHEQPSLIQLDIKPQKIKPAVIEGKSVSIGELNIVPKTKPKVAAVTPMLIVNQNGPITDLR